MDQGRNQGSPFDKPVSILRSSDPLEIARRAGVTWKSVSLGEGHYVVPVLNACITVGLPDIQIEAPPELDSFPLKLLTLIYLSQADGTPPSGEWLPFREIPGGRFYSPVVERSVDKPLSGAYGDDTRAFEEAALLLGGTRERFGDVSFSFDLFPLVRTAFIVWRADPEFPARTRVLFDASSPRHLSAFELRMGAQEISKRLIRFPSR